MLKEISVPCSLVRDGEFQVMEQCTRIRGADALTYLDREKFLPALGDLNISCVICKPEFAGKIPEHIRGIIFSDDPKLIFFLLHNAVGTFVENVPTKIDSSARISPLAYVAPYNVIIGPRSIIGPFVMVGEGTEIQEDVHIHEGCTIGAQGFTSVRNGDAMFLAKDLGKVRIERGVEICAHCDVARGTLLLDTTVLGAYTKLDAKVHIGHGSVLGKRVLVPSGAHIAGNCVVGDDVWIGVNATVSNRIKIGEGARVSLGSVVTKDVPAGQTVTGNFAIDHARFMKNLKASVLEADSRDNCPPPVDKQD